MTANKHTIDSMRKLGFSADSIAIKLPFRYAKVEAIEHEPVAALAEVKHGVCRCGGALV